MKLDVFFTPREAEPSALHEATVVVVDVVRATTSMVEALAHGARGIYPTASTEEAVRLAGSLGRDDTLLVGERKGVKIEGFDLGNSPAEFSREVVAGKRLVWTTTNGTAAFAAAAEAPEVIALAFTNLSAIAAAVRGRERLTILCAGTRGRFALEDALCAGHLARRLLDGGTDAKGLNDAARAALALAGELAPGTDVLADTDQGRFVTGIGLGADLERCARVDVHAVVPRMRDQALSAGGGT